MNDLKIMINGKIIHNIMVPFVPGVGNVIEMYNHKYEVISVTHIYESVSNIRHIVKVKLVPKGKK